ncbi:hypothetical protein ACFVAJ_03535 [Agromyces sp. NPDC057679]|uniref:hypothetical protein n=1 Tax=Agromyces sp. NPDC057679 TaxID=3346207 RepID=UPI003672BDAC
MPDTLDRPAAAALSTLPGATIIRRIRGMIFSALSTALVYSFVGTASKGGCVGGSPTDGFMEVNGSPADIAPTCVQLNLRPSAIVFVAIAVTVIVAITLVLRPGRTEASALRVIDRAVVVMIAGTLAFAALTMVSFFAIPLDPPSPGEPFMIPFTFGHVEVDITP